MPSQSAEHRGRRSHREPHFHPRVLAVETESPPHHNADDRAGEVRRWPMAEPVHSWVQHAVGRTEESKEQAVAEERTALKQNQSASVQRFAGSNSGTDNAVVLPLLAPQSCKSDTNT